MTETSQPSPPTESKPPRPVAKKGPDARRAPGNQTQGSQGKAALVLSLIAIVLASGFAASAYFIWNEVQQLGDLQGSLGSRVDERVQPLNVSLERLSGDVESATRKLDGRIEALGSRLDTIAENQQGLDKRLVELAELTGRSEHGWRLAEVEYLLRIASQRLQLQRDVDTAEAALQSADTLLRDLADLHYLKVREQIARELEALGSIADVDRNGIALMLGAWLEQIDGLAVEGARYAPQPQAQSAGLDTTATVSDWREIPGLVWAALSELFHLREHDKPVTPMLPPEREYFLRENLRLQLAAARLALMRADAAQYQTALDGARDWLGKYFSAEDPQVRELISQIEELVAVNIRPELPGVSGSLRVLRQQMKLRESQNGAPVAPERQSEPAPQSGSSQAVGGVDEVEGQ